MIQITKSIDIVGKTIKSAETITSYGDLDECFVIVFDDDTYCVLNHDLGYIDVDTSLYDCNPSSSNFKNLYDLGLITSEEMEKWKEVKRKEDVEKRKQRDINELNRLRKLYPED